MGSSFRSACVRFGAPKLLSSIEASGGGFTRTRKRLQFKLMAADRHSKAALALAARLPYPSSNSWTVKQARGEHFPKRCSRPAVHRMPAGRSKVLERVPQILQATGPNRHRCAEPCYVTTPNSYASPLGTNFEDVSSIRGQPLQSSCSSCWT